MAFEPAPLLIGLREGLEALLVLGILLGMLDRLHARDRRGWVWLGFGAGIVVSVVAGILIQQYLATWFEQQGGAAAFEVVVALAAVAVLSYMVLWMQRNAGAMMAGLKERVATAVTERQMWALAFLGFITVVREGLEVVLFFSALSETLAWADLILWGTVGLAASGVVAFLIFRLTLQVDLRRFFAVTGVLLIFIAAGLLVHVVHAASDLGWIGHGTPLWDTSGALPDEDHWLGGPLHALVGYEDQPTLLQLVLYTTYLVGVGGWYLASLRPDQAQRSRAAAAGVLILLLVGLAVAGAVPQGTAEDSEHAGHESLLYDRPPKHLDHKAITAAAAALVERYEGRIGVLVRSHGEPIHYNASTYESFKEFIRGIWGYTDLPAELLDVDQGTYYIDEAHPFSSEPHLDAKLVDAWVRGAEYPALPACDPHGLEEAAMLLGEGCYHFTPGLGSGVGEGDLFEVFGLSAYRTWIKMDNHSPKTEQTEDHFVWMEKHLANHFGDKVVVAFAHHIDPHVGQHRTLEGAARELVDADVDVILDSYHSSVHSDSMNTCMMRHHAHDALLAAGYRGRIVEVGMAGTHAAWGEAVASYLAQEMHRFRDGEAVSVHLAQHGGTPGSGNPCGPEGSVDQYHANMDEQFAVAKQVIRSHFGDRFTLRHVYGQGAGASDDGELSPIEALELDKQEGIRRVVVIPYEFWSDAMDNLVPLRESFGFEAGQAPYYDSAHETHLTVDGVHVGIWSAHYGVEEKGTAHLARISEAIESALGG